ncbi:hypothetical protein Ngar_c04740 [Candidatus Nitrososphaera gargensis Ga9.2]|uniref:Uncharacterized protein n=1 Tax=Nitrososphaera gargensis (strain Ga9.2) TaxID=1237085 RepID=K0IF37_NITGG|nr:hypothetical protein Ngar_c04740 [Candidatus Nitrososphaera gargensis Ga9.2]
MEMKMKNCRSIFATYLRTKRIETEFIDLLQGRIPKSVFARHYFRPDFKDNCKKNSKDNSITASRASYSLTWQKIQHMR